MSIVRRFARLIPCFVVISLISSTGPVWACPSDSIASRGSGSAAPISVTPRGGPDEVGQWTAPQDWPVIAIHAALLPTGEVLQYSYPDDSTGSRVMIWNPASGKFTDAEDFTDIFCSGLTFLEDGSLFVIGGNNTQCFLQGRRTTQTFNPFDFGWTFKGSMSTGRWYPNAVKMGDGRILITSGMNTSCVLTSIMEIYTPGVGLEVIPEGELALDLFPRNLLLTSGKVAHVGPEELTSTFDPVARVWEAVDYSDAGYRDQGTSVLLPGVTDQIMIMGGYVNGTATKTCEILDFNDLETGWRPTGSLNFARAHVNSIILPDGKVMVVGGGTVGFYDGPVMNAELYDPATETWTLLPAQVYGRMYHSTTILLQDGRVLSSGQDSGPSANLTEIYEPPYLFRGERPVIDSAPTAISYGYPFSIGTSEANDIGSVVLMAINAVTHSFDNNQRYVPLDYSVVNEETLTATAPLDGNHAPPGHYQLFILNGQGVPSESLIVQLTATPPPPPICVGDANGDNSVDPLDSGWVLARLGCPVGTGDPECDIADQNADGVVDPLDVGAVLAAFGDCP